jgi:hypothetical protein
MQNYWINDYYVMFTTNPNGSISATVDCDTDRFGMTFYFYKPHQIKRRIKHLIIKRKAVIEADHEAVWQLQHA